MSDLEAISAVLAPLDLHPIFQVPSGDLLTGLTGLEPHVAVRGVHLSAFGASIGPGRSTPSLEVELLDRGMVVRVESISPRRLTDRLLAGDLHLLEEIHASFAFCGMDAVEALRRVVAPLRDQETVTAMRRQGEAALALAGEGVRLRARGLLDALRWFLVGLHLAETGEWRPSLKDLAPRHGEAWLTDLAERPGNRVISGSPAMIGFWMTEARRLGDALRDAAAGVPSRDRSGLRSALDAWCDAFGSGTAPDR